MKELKSAIMMIMQPDEPFLEWIAQLGSFLQSQPHIEPNQSMVDITAVLIEQKPSKLNEFLINHCDELLADEFSRWTVNEDLWPVRSDVELLFEYFRLEFYENIIDLRESDSSPKLVALLKPTDKLMSWLRETFIALHENPKELDKATKFDIAANSSAYLLPLSLSSTEDVIQYITDNYASLFDYELNRYIKEPKYWPKLKNFEVFKEWFELGIYPISRVLHR